MNIDEVKVIFIDIDGTLTNNKKELSNNITKSISNVRKKGIEGVLCSGRTNEYVCNKSKEIKASPYAISCNGAFIYNYDTDEILFN